ncbi:GG23710 [Ramicandelaber brevisporus]|nr:GG23710 [Ramicandelaber brevisporus]
MAAAKLEYHVGFGNSFASEAIPGALPKNQSHPQHSPFGLYIELLSGSAFTVPRAANQRSLLYRKRPSTAHKPLRPAPADFAPDLVGDFSGDRASIDPNQLRWDPFDLPTPLADGGTPVDFVRGLHTFCGSGDPTIKEGLAVHVYAANASMQRTVFSSSDGDMLIVPQLGALDIQTEFGHMAVAPTEICVIQRGIRFAVRTAAPLIRGYVLEVYSGHFELPELGPLGTTGLAQARDFLTPKAAFDTGADADTAEWTLVTKYGGRVWLGTQNHSPFDVVAWHGNYAPFKYDTKNFCAVGTLSFDHMDPSSFTMLTVKSAFPGTSIVDFIGFVPHWQVSEHSFRLPPAHRNCMTELVGSVKGRASSADDGKHKGPVYTDGGFQYISYMTPHGPDRAGYEVAKQALQPHKVNEDTFAFMFESTYMLKLTPWAMKGSGKLQDHGEREMWTSIASNFQPPQ